VRICWYWPFALVEEMTLATAATRPGDALVIQTLDRPGAPEASDSGPVQVVANLPEVGKVAEYSGRWFISRLITYVTRAARRRTLVGSGRFDVVHVMFQNYFTDWISGPRNRAGTVLVSTVHDVVPHQRRVPQPIQTALLRRLYARPGHIVVHHASVGRRLVADFGVDADRISVVAPQVPPARVPPLVVRDRAPAEVLFFGALRRNKGIDVLLAAAAMLVDRGDIRFRIAGRGFADMEDAVRRAASIDRRIVPELGWVTPDRKSTLFGSAALVVLPYTTFSSQSGVLHDAYAHAVPVVVTDVGALGVTVREEGTGWVVLPDARALADGIEAALGDPLAYCAAAARAREIAEERHPVRVGAQLRSLYDRLNAGNY
jgi:glycosyltransferase involved in cell wall biosynthesis